MNKITLLYGLIILFIFNQNALSQDKTREETIENGQTNPVNFQILPLNYANLKKHIIEKRCQSCHLGEDSLPSFAPIDLSTYDSAINGPFFPIIFKGDAEGSSFYNSVKSGIMPPGPNNNLSQEELDYIKAWINACAPETQADVIHTGECS